MWELCFYVLMEAALHLFFVFNIKSMQANFARELTDVSRGKYNRCYVRRCAISSTQHLPSFSSPTVYECHSASSAV